MFTNLFNLVENAAKIVVAPIDAVVSIANDGLEVVAEVVEDLAEDVKSITK